MSNVPNPMFAVQSNYPSHGLDSFLDNKRNPVIISNSKGILVNRNPCNFFL